MALPTDSAKEGVLTVEEGHHQADLTVERSKILVEVTGQDGTIVRSMADMPDGYNLDGFISRRIVSRALNGSFKTGFQSPASAYGAAL